MLEIILARHGETDWNVAEVFRGRADVGLNETGLKQAALLGEYLGHLRIVAVRSSPLKRARQTAGEVARHHGLEVAVADGLIDFDYGKWQGLSHREVRDSYKELYAAWREHPEGMTMPDGESLGDVRERGMAVVADAVAGYDGGTVVLVSHRVVNKVLTCALLGLDNARFWNIRQDTCGITRFNYTGGTFILTGHNDTSYLQSLHGTALADF